MKNYLSVLFAAIALPATLAAASFEGKVSFKMTSGREKPQDITYNIKGDKIRIELPGQKQMGGMIMDTAKKETTVIMDEQQMYMVMPVPDATAATDSKKGAEAKLEKTNETEKILGYTATKYISTYEGTTTEMWLAEGLGTFMSFSNSNPMAGGGRRGSGGVPQGWDRALAGKDLFPLRVVGKDRANKETFRLEATAVNKQTLPDSMFVPPPGYQKFDMGGMMKGMFPGGIPGGRQ